MQHIFKRTISFLMAVVMCISMLPVSALAAEDVSAETPVTAETTAPETETAVQAASVEAATEETESQETQEDVTQAPSETETEPVFDPENLAKLEIQTMPEKTSYLVGESIDLSGLVLAAEDANGLTAAVTEADGITVTSGDTSEAGKIPVTVAYGGMTVSYQILVHEGSRGEVLQDSTSYPESDHDYGNSIDITYTYTVENAEYLKLTFSDSTLTESGYDKIYLYDGSDTLLGTYSGNSLAGVTIQVSGDTVKIRLDTDGSVTRYGFSLSSIYAFTDTTKHEASDAGVYTEHGCFTDGYTTHTCWICGESFVETDAGTACHVYTDGFCEACGIPETAVTTGSFSETVLWAVTEDNVLYVSGVGVIPDNPDWSSAINAVTEVVVGEGITEIGIYAFYGCTSLTTVSLPDGLTVIDNNAFYNCYTMTGINIPDTVTTIGTCAFYNCDGLTSLYIPESVTTIAASSYSYSPFYNCPSTLKLYCEAETAPEGWGGYWNYYNRYNGLPTSFGCSMEDYVYWNTLDTSAESIVIPEGIRIIPANAFYNCSGLKSVTIPDSVTSIGSNAFYYCTGLTVLLIPESVTTISGTSYSTSPFYYCSSALVLYCEAASAQEGWGPYWNYRASGSALLTNYGFTQADVDFWTSVDTSAETFEIPEGVTAIPARAFYGCSSMTSITIPNTVKTIGDYAFYNCSALTELTLPDGITSIGQYAFYNCSGLTALELPDSLTAISDYMLYNCKQLTTLTIPTGVTSIGNYALYYCYSLTELTVPASVVSIGSNALYNCYGLTKLTLSSGLTSLGDYALYNCSGLTELTLPASLTTIGNYTFQSCKGLTSLVLPEGITSIGNSFLNSATGIAELTLPASLTTCGTGGMLSGSYVNTVTFAKGTTAVLNYALYNATRLTSVSIPDTVTTIGDYAFYGCSSLGEVSIAGGVEKIGKYAFYNCKLLTAIDLPESLTLIGPYAFAYCSSLTSVSIPAGVTLVQDYTFQNCSALTEVSLPAGLLSIGNYAFQNCSALAEITLPEGLTSIGYYAFAYDSALTGIVLPESLTTLSYSIFYGCSQLTELRLPASLTTVGHNGYRGPLDGSGITKVTFGEGLTSIPAYILSNGTSGTTGTYSSRITEVVFEDASQITYMGECAFYNCASLESIVIPDSIAALSNYAFYNCISLKSITLPAALTSFGTSVFYNCTALESIVIPESVTILPAYLFTGCTGLKQIELHDGLTAIGDYAFQKCTSLTAITLPDSLTILGYSVFYGCTGITEIRLPAALTNCGHSGARGPLDGSGITKVTFADGVTTVPAYVLSNYVSGTTGTYSSKITEVVFEDASKVTAIGNYAFQNCALLESFEIPGQVTAIPLYCFNGCNSLKEITIPETITSIGNYAFYNCTSLQDIVIPAGQTVGSYAYANCTGALTLSIGDGATIGSYAFRNCTGLTSIQIGSNVTIDSNAFYGVNISGSCGDDLTYTLDISAGLMTIEGTGAMYDYSPEEPAPWSSFASVIKDIEFGDGITGIGAYAFAGCTGLEAVVLPDNVDTVGENSFTGCSDMLYVEIPDGVSYIGDSAFGDCESLEEVAFLGDAPTLEDNVFGTSEVEVFYPETASGYTTRLTNKYGQYIWSKWDDTVTSKDIVLLLDVSGSMSGKTGTLSDASTQLIRSIGGALKKSNIAVVEYDDSTNMLCDFTTNTYRLVRSVSNLYDQGGTEYANALTRARTLLSGSTTDLQFVIMFSDGQPNDNKQNIYDLAASMQAEGTIIYTVGLGTNSTQRQVLINVAGSDTRYFEATNIAGLVAAFEELSENFGKSEYSTVEMKVNGARWDLFNDPYSMCLASGIPISIYLTPGTNDMYDNVASYALEQNGRYVATSTNGTFENIMPSDYFQSGYPVYVVLLDADGNVIERKELLLTFTDSFTISYRMGPDMGNEIYLEETFIPGQTINAPVQPIRIGYEFAGWYSSENCEGIDFFTALEQMGSEKMDTDTTVYAKWEEQATDIVMGKEVWPFTNSRKYFDGTWESTGIKRAHYEMTTNDYQKLIEEADNNADLIGAIDRWRKGSWGGSCFGMSSSALLVNEGFVNIYNFPEFGQRYTSIGDAWITRNTPSNGTVNGDDTVGNLESMINFYQIRWKYPDINDAFNAVSQTDESPNLKSIVRKMIDTDEPVVIYLRLENGDKDGYHAVIGFDLKETADGYTFQVYDCSQSTTASYPVTVTVEDDTYTASCTEWENEWSNYEYIFMLNAGTAAELRDIKILTAPGALSGASIGQSSVAYYALETSYGSFTISNGTDTAVISGGEQVSGTLDITCRGTVNWVDEDTTYGFDLPVLAEGESYTITQSGSGALNTTVHYRSSGDGFFLAHAAEAAGTLTVGSDGSIASQYPGSVAQELNLTHNGMTTPWYTVQISGESTGFTLTPEGDSVTVVSAEETTVDITAKSDFNDVTLSDVTVDTTEAQIQESEDNCVVVKDSQIIAGDVFGYSVAFNSQMGSSVPTLTNVPYGSLIEEPTDPTKTGYIFEGWFTDDAYTTLWNFDTDVVTEDLILYAGWSVNPNYLKIVTFRVPGCEDQIVYVPKGELIPVEYAPVDENGEAMVWHTRKDYANDPWDFAYDTVTEDLILYGKTTLCTVSYEPNNGTSIDDASVYAGNLLKEPSGLENAGYTLCGWYTDAEFTEQWNFDTDQVAEDMTLYAKWVENVIDKEGRDTGISIEIVAEADIVYTGKAVVPTVIVRDNGVVLTVKTDYTVSFKNNTAACDKEDPSVKANKLPQIVVQGKGNYKSAGKITKYFTIHQADMADLQVTIPTVVTVKSGNKLQTLKPVVSTALVKVAAKEYTVLYYADEALTEAVSGITEPGDYYVVLEGNGINLQGVTEAFKVTAAAADKLLSKAKITPPKTITSTGEAVSEDAAIQALISKLVLNKTTWLTDEENLAQFKELFAVTAVDTDGTAVSQAELGQILNSVGKKTITVTAREGNAEGLVGSTSCTVTVKGMPLNKKQFHVTFGEETAKALLKTDYTGSAQIPTLYTDLEADTDYTVTFLSGKTAVSAHRIRNAGTYSMVITGLGSYSGTLTYKFTINPLNLATAYANGQITITSPGTAVYSPSGAILSPTVSFANSKQLMEGVDYVLKCSGNSKVTDKATITLNGKGNFKGSLSKLPELTYSVVQKSLTSPDITVAITGITIKKDVVSKVSFTLSDGGKKIPAAQYTGSFTDDGETVTLTITGTEKNYTGSRVVTLSRDLVKASDKKQVLTSLPQGSKYYYTGEQIRPEIAVTDAEGNDISQCFAITYGANRNVGSGSIVLTGRPDMGYYGSVTVKFTILPKWMAWLFG